MKLTKICQIFNGRIVIKTLIVHKNYMNALKVDPGVAQAVRDRLDEPLVLIGLMGSGKTRIGRALAGALELPFYDSDDEIEKAAGMTVSDIFEKFGEPYFRDGEQRVINRLLKSGPCVLATGGGAVMRPETASLIWMNTISLWVKAEMAVMLERTSRSDRRPLLRNGNPEDILRNMMEKRYPVYEKADIVIESHNGPVEAILNQTLNKLLDFLS
jgi:shikimate kinase